MVQLRRTIERLLGLDPVSAGEDTQWHLRFDIGWPDWILLLFVVFAIVFVVSVYLREGTAASRWLKLLLAGVRLAVIALVAVMLSGLEISIDRTGLPYLVFLVDDSESMSVRDRYGEAASPAEKDASPARMEQVVGWLRANEGEDLTDLTARHKLQVYVQSTSARLLGGAVSTAEVAPLMEKISQLKPEGRESRLGSNLRTVLNQLRGTPPSSIVLVTDGVTTDGEPLLEAAQAAARKGIPIFTVGAGSSEKIRDLDLRDLLVDDAVFVDDTVVFEAKLSAQGFEGEEAAVTLRQKGIEAPLDRQTYRLGKDRVPIKVKLAHRPQAAGAIEYVIDVAADARESQVNNNKIERAVRVVDEQIRVLYVESLPRYEYRYLKNLLERERVQGSRRESSVALSVILLDADAEYVEQDRVARPFFPTTKEDLFEFDIVILGDVPASAFSQSQLLNIKEFVRVKGGGLLVIAGEQYGPQAFRDTTLAELFPVELGPNARGGQQGAGPDYVPRRTIEGRSSPLFRFEDDETANDQVWASLPPMYWHARVQRARPGAVVLLEHPAETIDGQPAVLASTQFFGAGRTYFQSIDETWRWRYRYGDIYHSRYWVQTLRLLSRTKLLGKDRKIELLTSRRAYRRGDPVQLRVRFLDEAMVPKGDLSVSVQLSRRESGERSLDLKRLPSSQVVFETLVTELAEGNYDARLVSPLVESPPSVEFSVEPPPGELDRVQMNEPELRQVAEMTGGKFYPLSKAGELFSELPAGSRVALHTDPPISLWDKWPMLIALVTLLGFEWVLRKRKQML